jgi:hypothetical protein
MCPRPSTALSQAIQLSDMSDNEKNLADRWQERAKNSPVVAFLVLLGFALSLVKPIQEPLVSLLKAIKIVPAECKIYSDFAVDLLYSDSSAAKRRSLASALDSAGYRGRLLNTGFEELQQPGKPGSAWVSYPSCLGNDDPRILKIINMMKQSGYSVQSGNLEIKPLSSPDFPSVQISLF